MQVELVVIIASLGREPHSRLTKKTYRYYLVSSRAIHQSGTQPCRLIAAKLLACLHNDAVCVCVCVCVHVCVCGETYVNREG